jgi:SIR2-like protein
MTTAIRLLNRIADSALFGSLGLFVGTGLSKDLTGGDAPSFVQVLKGSARKLGLKFDFKSPKFAGHSYPSIAEQIVQAYQKKNKLSRVVAEASVKREICRQCNLIPDEDRSREYREALANLGLQWVVTTNYDFIMEDIIPNSVTLGPRDILNSRQDYIPIFHMHGHLNSPEEIVVTESDYVRLFSPIDYRQLKLNLLLAESTTIMVGYSLGDINVKHAMEWQRTLKMQYGLVAKPYQSQVIQVLYVESSASMKPYRGISGELIIETNDLLEFLKETSKRIVKRRKKQAKDKTTLNKWLGGSQASTVADDKDARQAFLEKLLRYSRSYDIQDVVRFFDAVLDPVWVKARSDGGWEHYKKFLEVLVDVLVTLPFTKMHPSLLASIALKLDNVCEYMDADGKPLSGTSWAASKHWKVNKPKIPPETLNALYELARTNNRITLNRFLS